MNFKLRVFCGISFFFGLVYSKEMKERSGDKDSKHIFTSEMAEEFELKDKAIKKEIDEIKELFKDKDFTFEKFEKIKESDLKKDEKKIFGKVKQSFTSLKEKMKSFIGSGGKEDEHKKDEHKKDEHKKDKKKDEKKKDKKKKDE